MQVHKHTHIHTHLLHCTCQSQANRTQKLHPALRHWQSMCSWINMRPWASHNLWQFCSVRGFNIYFSSDQTFMASMPSCLFSNPQHHQCTLVSSIPSSTMLWFSEKKSTTLPKNCWVLFWGIPTSTNVHWFCSTKHFLISPLAVTTWISLQSRHPF